MSVWLFKPKFTRDEEEHLSSLREIELPFGGLPDLSGIHSEQDMRRLLARLHPERAPETINRQADVHWRNLSQLMNEDLLLIPLSHRDEFALAEVTDRYRYREEGGLDVHSVGVRWHQTNLAARRFNALSKMMQNPTLLQPIAHAEQRKMVYTLLDRPYNRFAGWRWLLGVIVVMQMIVMLTHMLGK